MERKRPRTASVYTPGGGIAVLSNHVKAAACRCGGPPERCISDGEVLTQYGKRRSAFRVQPRIERELGISLLRGLLPVQDAARHVLRREPTESDLNKSRIRGTTAGALRQAGFGVVHTPGRIPGGLHCTVAWPSSDPIANPRVPWPPEVSERFDRCFNKEEEGEPDEL